MVRKTVLGIVVLVSMTLGVGCATTAQMSRSYPALGPVPPPTAGHQLKVDNLLVISDISRSMRDAGKIGTEKALLTSFNQGIPKGLKQSGMRTFGKSAYYHTVLVQPVQKYDRSAVAELIGELEAGCGNTPLASALVKAGGDLEDVAGNIAMLIVSDGEDVSRDPIGSTLALKELYGGRLCIHTVHVGDSVAGGEIMKQIASHGGCGIAVAAADLESDSAMKQFITNVFFKHEYSDSDGDGVPDWSDKCPGTPKGVKVDANGCPLDSDGDGVLDYKDKCPNTPKGVKVDAVGCPLDSDGDGVPDYLDKCPGTIKGAPVNSVGCWTIKGINFDYDKWDIKPQYHGLLGENLQVLKMNPSVKVEIQGHTDSKGSDQYNQKLSEKRAESVKNYFVAGGVATGRISSRGYGESKPIATNETPEGRAKNRRIEIKVINK